MKEQLSVGLDLGTSHIRLAVGQAGVSSDKRPTLQIIGAAEVPASGFAKGHVVSLEDAVSSVTSCLEQAERLIGLPITDATVGIGGTTITSQLAKGVVGVSRPEGDIRPEDVERVLEAAKSGVNPANIEILHVLPRTFIVDGQTGIKDPVGMQGIRLEVEAQIVQGLSSQVRNLMNAVYRTGLDVTEIVYGPLAAAEAITSPRDRERGVCMLVIGAATTGLAVYEDGELLHAVTLPIGSDHITSDIAIGLRIGLDAAEAIKCAYGRADAEILPKRGTELDLSEFGVAPGELVPLRFIAEIIQARVEELFEKAEGELRRIDRSGMLPAGVILTGGGAKLPGLVDVGKRTMRLPCALGRAAVPSPVPEVVEDPAMSTAIGLVLWSHGNLTREDRAARRASSGLGRSQLLERIKRPFGKLFKSFLP